MHKKSSNELVHVIVKLIVLLFHALQLFSTEYSKVTQAKNTFYGYFNGLLLELKYDRYT
jgi:hypothetical protein